MRRETLDALDGATGVYRSVGVLAIKSCGVRQAARFLLFEPELLRLRCAVATATLPCHDIGVIGNGAGLRVWGVMEQRDGSTRNPRRSAQSLRIGQSPLRSACACV